MLIKQFEFSLFGVNTYVVWDPATLEAAIVDPAMMKQAEQQRLADFIAEKGLQPKHLINTHLHLDHTFGDEFTAAKYGLKLAASPADAFLGADREGQAQMFHLPVELPPIEAEIELHEGDKIWLGQEYMEVLEVPGHSPGSLVLWNPADQWLITGDVLFDHSIGRTDLPGGNHGLLVEGIRNKLFVLPPQTRVFPGHGPFTTIGAEMSGNPFV